VLDGFQATAAIRALGRKARVPIVAMTAYAMQGDADRCLAAGMDAYASKPIHPAELIALVERLAGGPVQPPARSAEAAPASPDPSPDEAFDFDEALRRCFGARQMFVEMVDFLEAEAPALLGRIRAAIERGEAPEAANAAHRLRGTLLYLGARPAQEAALQVERAGMAGDPAAAGVALQDLQRRIEQLRPLLAAHRTKP